ncbi:MAG: Fe2+-dependent dioxygenase [Idiomarina sp.]
MLIHLAKVIDGPTVAALRKRLDKAQFRDGKLSAGYAAKSVKQNQQSEGDDLSQQVIGLIQERLLKHPVWVQAAQPKHFGRCMLNRYGVTDHYGWHVDDAWMQGIRTDLSFTVSLSALAEYDGGALAIQDTSGERSWRLDTGDVLLYPSHYLHQVEAVSRGERVAMVGWLQSLVRDPAKRELLFELSQALEHEFAQQQKSAQFDRLSKVYQNLQRQWLE